MTLAHVALVAATALHLGFQLVVTGAALVAAAAALLGASVS